MIYYDNNSDEIIVSMGYSRKTIRTDSKISKISEVNQNGMRQMTISECFKKAKMRPLKIEKTLFIPPDECIVIDSDSDIEPEPSPPKRPKTIASTPKRASNIEDEATPSTSKGADKPAVYGLPSESPRSDVSDSSVATVRYDYSGHTFDHTTEPFPANDLADVLVLNDPTNFASDNTQNAWDGGLMTNVSQGGSIQPTKNGLTAKRRLSFRENNVTGGANNVATNNNSDSAKGNNPREDVPSKKSHKKSGDQNEQSKDVPDKKVKAARRPRKKKNGDEGSQGAEVSAKQNNLHAVIEKILTNNNMSVVPVNYGNIAQTPPTLGTAQKPASSDQTAVRTLSQERSPASTGWISKETPSRKRKSPVGVNNKENSKTPKVDPQPISRFDLLKSLSGVNNQPVVHDALTPCRVGDTRIIRQGASTSREPLKSTTSASVSQQISRESIIMIGNTNIKLTSKGTSDASQKPLTPKETAQIQAVQTLRPQSSCVGNVASIKQSPSTPKELSRSIRDANKHPRPPKNTVANQIHNAQQTPRPQTSSIGNAPSTSTSKVIPNSLRDANKQPRPANKSIANKIQDAQTPRTQSNSVSNVSIIIKQSASASKELARSSSAASKQSRSLKEQVPNNIKHAQTPRPQSNSVDNVSIIKQSASTSKEHARSSNDASKQSRSLKEQVPNNIKHAQTPRPQSNSVDNVSIIKQSASTSKEHARSSNDASKQSRSLKEQVPNNIKHAQTPRPQSNSVDNVSIIKQSASTSKEHARSSNDASKQSRSLKEQVPNNIKHAQTPRPQSNSVDNVSIIKQSASTSKEHARSSNDASKQSRSLKEQVPNNIKHAQTPRPQSNSVDNVSIIKQSASTSKEHARSSNDASKQSRSLKEQVPNNIKHAQTPRPQSNSVDNVSITKQSASTSKEHARSSNDASKQSRPLKEKVAQDAQTPSSIGSAPIASTSKEPANSPTGSSQIQQTPKKSAMNEGAGPSGLKSSVSKGQSTSKGSPGKNWETKSVKGKQGNELQGKQLDALVSLFRIVASNKHLRPLLDPDPDESILKRFMQMENAQKYVVMKLYVWQRKWYNIFKFCTKARIRPEDDQDIISIFKVLSGARFVDTDYANSVSLIELLNELDVPKLKEIMNELRIIQKGSTKKDLISDVITATSKQATLTNVTLADKVMDRISMKLGYAIKIRDDVDNAFYHLCLLATFTNPEFGDLQQYFRSVLVDRVVFPETLTEDYPVFYTRVKFEGYAEALRSRRQLDQCLTNKYQGNKYLAIYSIGEATYTRLQGLVADCDDDGDHAKTPHLKRFTAQHVYVGVLSICCEHIFAKKNGRPTEVKKWLEYLIETFPQSRRLGRWYHKLIWLHMRHLEPISYERAAQLLIEALAATKGHLLGERAKLELALLGEKLKASKTHKIEQGYHDRVAELVPRMINVSNFPHLQIDSQCIRSSDSGRKRVYVSRTDGERTMKHVEHVALDYYAENGYPGGKHCEGSLIKALLMLYFWDIIYDPERVVPGTFISKFQTEPLDMRTPHFYHNRKEAIDMRLEQISRRWSQEKFLEFGVKNFQNHSHECSAVGLVMNVIEDLTTLEVLVTVIARKVLAGIFARLIKNFRENGSGMPDLLVWNVDQKKHLFVEVKGEGDRLAPNQMLWLKYLQQIGASIQVCMVHSTGAKRKKIIATTSRSDTEG